MNHFYPFSEISRSNPYRENISLLMQLQSYNGAVRQHARELLVRAGTVVVPALLHLLEHPDEHVRWEACKTLGKIGDDRAGKPLAEALFDEDMDVRWVAAEGLIALGRNGIEPLLEVLETSVDSVLIREAAHHILHSLKQEFIFPEKLDKVYEALNHNVTTSSLAVLALDALIQVRGSKRPAMKKIVRHH